MGWGLLWSWIGAYSGHGLGPVCDQLEGDQLTMRLLILACGYHHGLGPAQGMGWGLLWSWVGAYSGHEFWPVLVQFTVRFVYVGSFKQVLPLFCSLSPGTGQAVIQTLA